MDSIPKLERLVKDKQAEYRRAADRHRLLHDARASRPGLRYRLAQGLVALAARLSPAHQARWREPGEEGACPGSPARGPAS